MKPVRALLLGLAAYAAFLLATIPAEVVARQAASMSAGQVRLSGTTGTAWNGSARLEVAARGISLAIDEVRWRFLPARLLAGRAAFQIEASTEGLDARFEFSRSPLAWAIRDLEASGDARALSGLHPLASAWQPAGPVVVESELLEWDGANASGSARVELRDAALALSPVRPLGSWRAQFSAQGAVSRVTLSTIEGPLLLAGEGTVAHSGRLAFTGEARAQAGHERDLEPLLELMGPRRPDGARAVEIH